jgi:chorismate-pyruvate lyase
MSTASSKPTPPTGALPIAYPLDDFYAQAGLPLPPIEAVPGEAVPEPYRKLLVHTDDMTPTLEKFHGDKIHINVLRRQQRDDFYFREVVLLLDKTAKPVEFGAIKINLSLFKPEPRQLILEQHIPLGTILAMCGVSHASRPKAYLRLESDAFINSILKLDGKHTLYGRRNTLWDPQHRALAEIVEILPPA